MSSSAPEQPPKPRNSHGGSALDLMARREQLRMRSEALRQGLALRTTRVRPVFQASDYVAEGVHWVRQNPALVALAGAALLGAVATRPRAFVRLGTKAFAAWQLFQRAQPMLRAVQRYL